MSSNDKDLEIDDMAEFELSVPSEEATEVTPVDEGLDLEIDSDEEFSLADPDEITAKDLSSEEQFGELSLDEPLEEISSSGDTSDSPPETSEEDLDELTLTTLKVEDEDAFSLGDDPLSEDLNLNDELSLDNLSLDENLSLDDNHVDDIKLDDISDDDLMAESSEEGTLSADAKEKLKEIDALMESDSKINISLQELQASENLDESIISDDLDLGSLNFSEESSEELEEESHSHKEEKVTPKKKKNTEAPKQRDYGQDFKDISGAYTGEMERMQATISNLRSDREELLKAIDRLEQGKVLADRQSLTMRAELDEKKIELTIMRKKLNQEVSDLKDRLKLFDEKRMILEEKNKILTQELDKASQKNKIDVKKVTMRERELEQKLELLKSDAETQIRHRDLKILELKRKIDAMEFDMESISTQEKRSVESRFELEDKLDKAIKTLRSAITVLEDESDRSSALDALKKNIDM